MAIFHLAAKVVSRKAGQSVVAKAAYNAREELTEEKTGEVKDYSRAQGLIFSGIYTAAHAPEWAHDRAQLWNKADQAEKRKDATLAREYELALPHELTNEQRRFLVQDFVRESFTRKGYAVDVAIHAPDRGGDQRNYHAHILVSDRRLEADGFAADKKERKLKSPDRKAELEAIREKLEHLANRHLERYGHEARIDRRSLKDQGIDREPTEHLGPYATQLERDGEESERGNANRDIEARNQEREEAQRDYEAAQAEREQWEERIAQAAIQKAEEDQKKEQEAKPDNAKNAEFEKPPAHEEQKKLATPEKAAPERWEGARASDRVGEGLDYIGNQAEGIIEGIAEGLASLLGGGSTTTAPQKTTTPEKAAPERWEGGKFRVIDKETGVVTGLSNGAATILDGMSGGASPADERMTSLERTLQAMEERAAREEALENICEAIKDGDDISAADLRNLPREELERIRDGGDEYLQNMARQFERERDDWGRERER